MTPKTRARRSFARWTRLGATLVAALVSGCPQHLTPTPKGAVFHDWNSAAPATQTVTRRFRLRRPEGNVADFDVRLGLTEHALASLRCTLVENYSGVTLRGLVSPGSSPTSEVTSTVLLMASQTGAWTSRGNVYSRGSGVIEVRHGFALTGQRGARFPSCAEPPPTELAGDMCER